MGGEHMQGEGYVKVTMTTANGVSHSCVLHLLVNLCIELVLTSYS